MGAAHRDMVLKHSEEQLKQLFAIHVLAMTTNLFVSTAIAGQSDKLIGLSEEQLILRWYPCRSKWCLEIQHFSGTKFNERGAFVCHWATLCL